MEQEPWEALDVDDSELPSLLRPCKRKPQNSALPTPKKRNLQPQLPNPNSPSLSSPTLIPGPAAAVQAAMLRKLQNKSNPFCNGDDPLSTQEYIRRAVEDPGPEGDEFSRDPWLFTLEYIDRQGLGYDDGTIGTPLSSIKTDLKIDNTKVDKVVAVIKSCTPNGLGDFMVTLKDPTGTINASIHRKVLVEGGFGKDITVGTVLILQKVSVFSPSRAARYLNITLSNVVTAISKDSELLSEPNPASTVEPTFLGVENSKQPWNQQKACTVSSERNEEIVNSLRHSGYMRGRVHNDKGIEGDEALGSSYHINVRNRSQNAFVRKEPSVRQDAVSRMKKPAVTAAGTHEHEENVVLEKQPSPRNLAGRDIHLENNQSSGGSNLFGVANSQESVTMNGDKKQRQLPISKSSLPQWTDEQLDELCSSD
ncbi:hypothetical protein REPUB_Repub07fG0094600 [Reevesia pubescens]